MKICKCKSCGASIVWIKTQKGKNMPCDADAVEYQENYKAQSTIVTEDGRVLKASIITPSGGGLTPVIDGKGYIPHWATCPYANTHRARDNVATHDEERDARAKSFHPYSRPTRLPSGTTDDLDYYADLFDAIQKGGGK